jgi:hypothetical protein
MKLIPFLLFTVIIYGCYAFRSTKFELDGNVLKDTCADDWNSTITAKFYSGVINDPGITTVFQGSTSRANGLISSWKSTNVAIVNIKDLTNAVASYYDNNIYFGVDRYGAQRSTPMAVWLMQDDVNVRANGTFNGNHKDGDLLIITEFDPNPIVNIYIWSGSDVIETQLNLNGLCQQGLAQKACTINNLFDVPSSWPYFPIVGLNNVYPSASFLEGGVDLELIYPNPALRPCFRTMLVATMANSQTAANMQDYIIVPISTCALALNFDCNSITPNIAKNGFVYDYKWSLLNDGSGPLYKVNVSLNGLVQKNNIVLLPQTSITQSYLTNNSAISLPLGTVSASSLTNSVDGFIISVNKNASCVAPIQSTRAVISLTCYASEITPAGNSIKYYFNGKIDNIGFGSLTVSEHRVLSVTNSSINMLTVGNVIPPFQNLPFSGNFESDRSENIRTEYVLIDYLSNNIIEPNSIKNICPRPDFKYGIDLSYTCSIITDGYISQITEIIQLCNFGQGNLNTITTSHSKGQSSPVSNYGSLLKNNCVVYPFSYTTNYNETYVDEVTVIAKVLQYASFSMKTSVVCKNF